MTENLQPLPDEHLEARITAYVLGEASPFEAAEVEALIAKSPELKLFANRTRTLHTLLKEAETTSNESSAEWKLPAGKRGKLTPSSGPVPVLMPAKESRIRRASFRAAIGIAACFVVTFIISRFYVFPKVTKESAMTVSYMEKEYSARAPEANIDQLRRDVRQQEDKVEGGRKTLATLSRTKGIAYDKESVAMARNEAVADAKEETKKAALERSIDTEDYADAKQDFESDLARLETLKLKLLAEEISEDMPAQKAETAALRKPSSPLAAPAPAATQPAAPQVVIGGQVREAGSVAFKEGMTLGEAVKSAGGATEFGSAKRIKVYRDGKAQTYDLTNPELAQIELQANDTIEVPQKKWMGCGASRDELLGAEDKADAVASNQRSRNQVPVPSAAAPAPSADFGDGQDFGGGWGEGGGLAGGRDESMAMKGRSFRSDSRALSVPKEGTTIPGIPLEKEVAALVTGGLRSGDQAVNRNSVDAILNNPDRTAQAGKPKSEMKALQDAPGDAFAAAEADPFSAPEDGLSSLAQREVIRRQESVAEADRQLLEGREAYSKGDFGKASEQFDDALAKLPDSPAMQDRRESYADHLGKAAVAEAQQKRKVGKYDEARDILEKTAAAGGGNQEEIKAELGYLDDPIRTNPALTYEHTKKVDEVRRKLYMAQANYDLGKYDDAKKAYEDTLRIDPYNQAARRGMEKISAAKSDYYRAAYDQTRAELLMQVDKAWELAAPAEKNSKGNEQADPFADPTEPGEIVSFSGLFSDGIVADSKESANSNSRFKMDRAGAERSDFRFYSEFDGFANRGAPIADEPKQIDFTTKFTEITQANDKELGFDWILPGFDSAIPVTPATPTDFESRLGIEDEVPMLSDIPIVGKLSPPQPIDLADLSQEIPATQEPFSTFSLNISDASFQVASSAVAKGERPDPESIKPEQFYNAVSYDDPAPSTGEPVAAAIGQVAHPVIPGRNLVRMSVRTASTGRAETQPLILTLLVDQSGSMARGDRRAAMDTALSQLATLLTPDDRVTVIGFSRTPRLLADSISGNDADKLPDIINQSASEGGTNLEQAIDLAENLALRHRQDGAQNRIVLFTDGAANLGNADPERLAERVKALRQQDLAFDIAGIGTNDINDQLLSELSRHGNGRYYLVGENTAGNLAKQLAGAFRPAAENVKIQVKFNAQRVGSYKLIGFEKDRLKTEDFRNDSVDAAELAADESGTALYQVEPLPNGSGEIGELFVRFRDTATGEMVERSWTIPYESQALAIDKVAPPMQLAVLSLLAAQKLQPGPLADAINFRDFSETIAQLKQAYANDAKAQQMLNLVNALK
ncbi:von Willebrand factor type A domain-containing protein [Akkermansiaceae bacterium]|nr:von Willebrand factor type A domain-containing protein [Akkermansiaceae bacterium]